MKIRITWPAGQALATLDDTPTVDALAAALPISASANTWGQEVYFRVPASGIKLEEGAEQVVDAGTVCFWVDGNALALPYGPTPISQGDECRLVSPCNVMGRLDDDPSVLGTIRDGDSVQVSAAD